MAECWKCNKNLVGTGPQCSTPGCPWKSYKKFVDATLTERVFVFGEDHKFMQDVPFLKGLLTCLCTVRKPVVFLFELLPSEAPPNLIMKHHESKDGYKKVKILPFLSEDDEDDVTNYQCSWSKTAEEKGILEQSPFLDENFTIRPCFQTLCSVAQPFGFGLDTKLPSGDHTRNQMLMKLAEENQATMFGIDLPGASYSHMQPGLISDAALLQRFDNWNLLRDTWMSRMIQKAANHHPNAVICAFIGADHSSGIERGGRQIDFRYNGAGDPVTKKIAVTNGFCLHGQVNAIYLEPSSYAGGRSEFQLQPQDTNHWKY